MTSRAGVAAPRLVAWLCSAPPARHPGTAKAFRIWEPAQVWQRDGGPLGTETSPGKSSAVA